MVHEADYKFDIKSLSVSYAGQHALKDVSFKVANKSVTALIGASGCGKSTFLRCLNRMNDLLKDCKISGSIKLDQKDINGYDVYMLRRRVGMVFQKPQPFPMSVYDNVAYGPKLHKMASSRAEMDEIVHDSLKKANLYYEVNDRLNILGTKLSGGQQQRLCMARALAVNPDVLLLDEPCASLDPCSTAKIEELIDELSSKLAIVIVTHSMQQAARVSEYVAFFDRGELIEFDVSSAMFTRPKHERTMNYVTGRFG